jgi:hypothetical protein
MTDVTDASNPKEIDISWQSFDGTANEILLVAYVQGDCADNIQVYRIQPAFSFTLDIAGLMPDGTVTYGDGYTNANECVSPVWSALYNSTTPELTVDYGGNYVYFSVNAANFVNSWQPTFTTNITGTTGSTVTEIAWAYEADAISATGNWNFADLAHATNPGIAPAVTVQEEVTTGVKADAVGSDGECIIVRVLVEHGENETLAETTVTLGVNGIMYDQANATARYTNPDLRDVDEPETAGGDCRQDHTDTADYLLTPRPEVLTDTEPGEAAGDQDDFEPKNP